MLNKTLIILVIVVSGIVKCPAQTDTGNVHTVLWRVTRSDIKDTSYLLGTMHVISEAFVTKYPVIKECLLKTTMVATEIDINKIKFNPDDYRASDSMRLKQYATRKQHRKIKRFFVNTMHLKKRFINNADIYNLYMMFDLYSGFKYAKSIEGRKGKQSLDEYCAKFSNKNNIPTCGLEESDIHFNKAYQVFCNCLIPTREQMIQKTFQLDSMIIKYKNDPDHYIPSYAKEIKQYWELGFQYELSESPSLDSGLAFNVHNRNIKWMPKIEEMFSEQSTMIAVGFAHLCFKFGLISLLREKGYSVEPVSIQSK